MSLRDALKTAVARCTPQQTQHATFYENGATHDATTVQQVLANPHGIRKVRATSDATDMQQADKDNATQGHQGEKLQVAFASTCNTQPGPLTAHRVTAALIEAAMQACDHHGDSEQRREEMRADVLATPLHLRLDLMHHMQRTYGRSA